RLVEIPRKIDLAPPLPLDRRLGRRVRRVGNRAAGLALAGLFAGSMPEFLHELARRAPLVALRGFRELARELGFRCRLRRAGSLATARLAAVIPGGPLEFLS